MKKLFYFLLMCVGLFLAARLYYRLTDDFRIANIVYPLPFKATWETPSLNDVDSQNLKAILDQPYFYIGKGAQCYAFESKDGEYVLKFFKFKHLKPNLFVDALPSISPFKAFKEQAIERKKRKLISVFNGYDLAYRENREASELIYLHLVPTTDLHLNVLVYDKIGFERNIELDPVVFLIQRKGETLRTHLRNLLDHENLAGAKEAMAEILSMYISEYKKGIYDHDHGVLHNTGFVDGKPFHLDVGKLNQDDRMKEKGYYKFDLEHVIWKIDVWVKANYPNYYSEIASFLSDQFQKLTGDTIDTNSIDPKRFKKQRKRFGF